MSEPVLTEARPRDPLGEEPMSTGRAGTSVDSCARVLVAGWYQLPLAAVTNPPLTQRPKQPRVIAEQLRRSGARNG